MTENLPVNQLSSSPALLFLDADAQRLVDAFFAEKSEKTIQAYKRDLQTFCRYLDVPDITTAVRDLFSRSHKDANLLALGYKKHLKENGLKARSINRHLSSLRSLIGLAQSIGMIPWSLNVKNLKVDEANDPPWSVPDPTGIRRIIRVANNGDDDRITRRNVALVKVIYTAGLRRNEAVSLDYPDDVSLERGTIKVLGKGKTDKVELSLPNTTIESLKYWLEIRGDQSGPLFTNFDPVGKGDGRLSGRSVHRIVRTLGQEVGFHDLQPHSLRRSAITNLLEAAKGKYDVKEFLDFSRHADVSTMMIYKKRQNRKRNQADMSRILGEDL